ncbi:MAG: cytochrome c oxidase subunit II [Balneola sp.]|nr:cytochrome c oxidase subunit II [Balneola sp.]MBO6650895.1 cytochrome c oxidase subunit II [Balneola sp.]MBO6711837.1 cytochrome c oxidase subunit II [Balneola sp.]MBO6800032.1 cytochrome c oxidase subunit II [Balneola sp.]MBO6871587.1 cytochrome c oxidase subunit II [Balneola sp.]
MDRLFEFMLPEAKSPTADSTDALFHFINEVSLVLLIGITFALIYFAIKYRRRSEDDETPVITHNNTLEITWSVVPLLICFVIFGWGYTGWLNLKSVPDNAYEIQVNGFKWGWNVKYANGAQTLNEIHVPEGRPVKIVLQSSDVLHSFFVPDYRVKHDVVPGRYTYVWFEAEEAGESIVFCTEYCGTGHSDMLAKVIVHTEEDFQTWLEKNGGGVSGTPVEQGEQLVQLQGCTTCHSDDGTRLIGPSFKGLWESEETLSDGSTVTVDENYLRESILNPGAKIVESYDNVMTPYEGRISDEEITNIIEYLKTLK